ncbi:hypothetical protein [Mesorhizobium sp. BHbdii]
MSPEAYAIGYGGIVIYCTILTTEEIESKNKDERGRKKETRCLWRFKCTEYCIPLWGSPFGPDLRRFVLAQYHQGQVTMPRLVALLAAIGIAVSKREVVRLLIDRQERFRDEAPWLHPWEAALLQLGNGAAGHFVVKARPVVVLVPAPVFSAGGTSGGLAQAFHPLRSKAAPPREAGGRRLATGQARRKADRTRGGLVVSVRKGGCGPERMWRTRSEAKGCGLARRA